MSRPARKFGYRLTADQVTPEDMIELSDGLPIVCMPTQSRGGSAQSLGAAVLTSDPAVEYAATEVGFSPRPEMLRAPDVAVLPGPPGEGWLKEAPPLAVEYADRGQDWADLRKKIREYLENGVQRVWVVRMDGPRRVEVYTPDGKKESFGPGKLLLAPGILANPVLVEAMYNAQAARDTVRRNVLSREGYASLEAVLEAGKIEGRAEGRSEGRAEGEASASRTALLETWSARFGPPPPALSEALAPRDATALRPLFAVFATRNQREILDTLNNC